MDTLPPDLIFKILIELEPSAKTLCDLSEVSKNFYNIADSDDIWEFANGYTKTDSAGIISTLVFTNHFHTYYPNKPPFIDDISRSFTIAQQMLRVPVKVRRAAASARSAYYREANSPLASHPVSYPAKKVDDALAALTKIEKYVKSLIDQKVLSNVLAFSPASTCCALSVWAK